METGEYGRLINIRLKPEEDLLVAIEQVCRQEGVKRAVLRSALGSLLEARLLWGGDASPREQRVAGPGVEILSVYGEIDVSGPCASLVDLRGIVADPSGRIFGGRFKRGENRTFVTVEAWLQEWLPVDRVSLRSNAIDAGT